MEKRLFVILAILIAIISILGTTIVMSQYTPATNTILKQASAEPSESSAKVALHVYIPEEGDNSNE
ncbi:MAG: hypothetical protein HYS32_03270 [Candidatus Woesearchaeota archaeon]|nr:MAG: hypothetical protein HYS32_03270 [Candidatus Woesearchaeota archaeon]